MGQKPRDKKSRYSSKISKNILGDILREKKNRPQEKQDVSQQKNAMCEVYDCEVHELIKLLADIATGMWRIKNKFSAVGVNDLPNEIKKAYRHVESTWDALASAKVEVRNHTKEKYVAGMALNVIAFQPSSSIRTEMITETIKPSIFYNGKLIQRGDVIVETPEKTQSKKSYSVEDDCETKERNKK